MLVTMHTLCLLSWMLNFYTKQNFQLIPLNFVVLSNEPKYKGHHTNKQNLHLLRSKLAGHQWHKIFICNGYCAVCFACSGLSLIHFSSLRWLHVNCCKTNNKKHHKLWGETAARLHLVFRTQSLVNSRSLIMSLTALVIVSLFIHWRLIPS